MIDDKPTEITIEDIDNFVKQLMESEIKPKTCYSCSKEYYFDSYGHMFMECDECYFKKWPKEEREEFFRSFF
jgi:hypothetical protein